MQQRESISSQLSKFLEDSKNRSYFVAFVTFGFLALFVLFGIIPVYSSILGQIEENNKIERTTQQAQKKLADFQRMNQELENNADAISYFKDIFPEENEQVDIAAYLETIANQHNLTIVSINFKGDTAIQVNPRVIPRVSENVERHNVGIVIEGSREDGLQFLRSLENSRRIIDITNLVFSNEIFENQTDVTYALVIDFTYYVWNPNI